MFRIIQSTEAIIMCIHDIIKLHVSGKAGFGERSSHRLAESENGIHLTQIRSPIKSVFFSHYYNAVPNPPFSISLLCCYFTHVSFGLPRNPNDEAPKRGNIFFCYCNSNKNIGGNHPHNRSCYRREGRMFGRSQ